MLSPQMLLQFEQSLNERWSVGDPTGYFDVFHESITYFDPVLEAQLFGKDAVLAHIKKLYRNPEISRTEYLNASVVSSAAGDLAVLSYNMKNYVADQSGGESLIREWNTTEVYCAIEGQWRIVHSHWALTSAIEAPVV